MLPMIISDAQNWTLMFSRIISGAHELIKSIESNEQTENVWESQKTQWEIIGTLKWEYATFQTKKDLPETQRLSKSEYNSINSCFKNGKGRVFLRNGKFSDNYYGHEDSKELEMKHAPAVN